MLSAALNIILEAATLKTVSIRVLDSHFPQQSPIAEQNLQSTTEEERINFEHCPWNPDTSKHQC